MTGRFRIGIAAAVALLLTSAGLMRLLAPGTWIWPVVGVVIVSTLAGEAGRRLVRPRPLVVAIQVVAVFWYEMVLLAHEVAFGGILPTFAVFHRLPELYRQGADDINHTVPGGPATAGIAAIVVMSLGALAVLVDALAATYAVAPLAGLPLLALYLVPATRVGGGLDWLAFTVAAGGYTALLSAEGRDRLGRWGRPLVHAGSRRPADGADGRPARVDTGPIAATGHQITMFALVAAVLAPLLLPTVSSGLFGLGPGNGNGPGTGDNNILNQALDLKANLASQDDAPVLTYKTSNGSPQYIRMAAMDDFYPSDTSNSWYPAQDVENVPLNVSGQVSTKVPGRDEGIATSTVQMQIKLLAGISSTAVTVNNAAPSYSVPAPYAAQNISGTTPEWTVDPTTLSVFRPQSLPKGYEYNVSFADTTANLTNVLLEASPVVDDVTRKTAGLDRDLVTTGFPDSIKKAAHQVVTDAGATTPIDMARALQSYFKDSKQFHYSLSDLPPGRPTGVQGLDWMMTHKTGYCVYFASAMTAMARELHIPARMAIGFTQGSNSLKGNQAGWYTVTKHDYHAWPELYFQGIGWLRFEPTVGIDSSSAGGHGAVPGYATQVAPSKPTVAPTTAPTGPAASGPTSSSNCTAAERRAGDCGDLNSSAGSGSHDKFGSLGWFGAVPRFFDYWLFGGSVVAVVIRFVLLVLLLVACVPMAVRFRRRRRRLTVGRRSGRGPKPGAEPDDGLQWESAEQRPSTPTADPERRRILAAWAEVRDSATDLGYSWPASETPRQSAARITKQARLSTSASAALTRVTGLTETASYARTIRPGTAPATLFDDVKAIRVGLADPVSRRTRLRAAVLPPSALAALRERREEFTGRVYERVQRAGARLRPVGRGRGEKGPKQGRKK